MYLCRKLLHGLHELLQGHRAGPVLVEDAEGSLLEELLHYKDGRSDKDFSGVAEGECEDLERKLVIELLSHLRIGIIVFIMNSFVYLCTCYEALNVIFRYTCHHFPVHCLTEGSS